MKRGYKISYLSAFSLRLSQSHPSPTQLNFSPLRTEKADRPHAQRNELREPTVPHNTDAATQPSNSLSAAKILIGLPGTNLSFLIFLIL